MKISVSKRCIYRKLGDTVFIEHLNNPLSRQIIGGIGTEVWDYLEHQPTDTEKIVKDLSERYKVRAQRIERDVFRFLNQLYQHKLIEVIDGESLGDKGSFFPDSPENCSEPTRESESATLYEQVMQQVEDMKLVIKAHIEVTYACNFKCVQCYVGPLLNDKRIFHNQLTTNELIDIISQLTEQGCMRLTFTGGELFSRGDILEVLQYASDKRCAVRLQTNGSLITEEIARRLRDIPTLETVEVSVYGMDQETSDSITRVKDSLERTVNSIRLLKDNELPVYLKYVLMRQNTSGIHKARGLAEEMGIHFLTGMGNIYPTTTGGSKNTEYQVPEEDILKLFVEGKVPVPHIAGDCSTSGWLCKAGVVRCSITPTGDVWPCERLPFSFGNIRQRSFKDIWFSERAEWYRGMIKEEHNICKTCSMRQCCYQCWAMPYLYGNGISVEDALDFKGYSKMNCRLTNITQRGHELVHVQRKPGSVYSQVF